MDKEQRWNDTGWEKECLRGETSVSAILPPQKSHSLAWDQTQVATTDDQSYDMAEKNLKFKYK